MDGINTDMLAPFDGNDSTVRLLYSYSMITNDSIDTTIGTGLFFWKPTKLKYRPFLKFKPISGGQCARVIRIFWPPKQLVRAMGAVVDGGAAIVVRNEDVIAHAGIEDAEFTAACDTELAEIERRRQLYLGNSERAEIAGHTAIVVDDGVATGATTRAALRATRLRRPQRLVLAVPVAPTDSLAELRAEADDVVCLEHHEMFGALGYYYRDFRQIADREVIEILERFQGNVSQQPRQAFEK
jgi:predicted phosphoribosyltransferase